MVLLGAGTLLFVTFMALLIVLPLYFWLKALLDVVGAPEPAFGPPGDNCKNAWLIGLIVAVALPAGVIVGAALWWTQGRGPLRHGQPVPRPFWAPRPAAR
jgi:hypothetical protein